MINRRKLSLRVPSFDYTGAYHYFVTCSTFKRNIYFREWSAVDIAISTLRQVSEKEKFEVIVYCFMPDHLHLLLSGADKSLLSQFVKMFKQTSGYVFKKACSNILWQRGYYDHVLRKDESLKNIALYILNNPVRAELVDDYRKYEFPGSFTFNITEL